MAISIQATPATYSSLQGDLIYTVAEVTKTADPTTYPNYKFVADVYAGGVMVARLRKVPNPVTKIGIFNIGQIVRNYVNTAFDPHPTDIQAQTLGAGEFSLSVQVKFGEEYAYTTYTNLTIDSARVFYNHYNGRIAGDTALAAYIDKPTTSRPYEASLPIVEAFCFVPYLPMAGDFVNVVVKTYDFSGALVETVTRVVTPLVSGELQSLNLAPAAINAFDANTINTGIEYYTVTLTGENSDTYRFNISCDPIYETFTLHFLNKFGGFESKVFDKVSRKTINIQKKDFGRLPYTVDSSGVVSYKSANNVYNESRSVYASEYKERMTLNSDLLTDAEYTWLQELVISPMVYLEDSGNFFPCVITENNYEPKKVINDELTNLTVNIEFGVKLNGQYR